MWLYVPQKTRKKAFITNVLEEQETHPPIGPYFADGPVKVSVYAHIIFHSFDPNIA
ncbi:MAG: hypothetical protein HYV36_02050 [Lentisphaerae bacterium]|nr:hypothetical protein [Lentisphaerota bacterium]